MHHLPRPDETRLDRREVKTHSTTSTDTDGPRLYDGARHLDVLPRERLGSGPIDILRRFASHLKQSKLVQWLATYLAVAWLTLQLVETLAEIWNLPVQLQRGISLSLGLLIVPAAVVGWYHGEQGRQRVCACEIAIVGTLICMTGVLIWHMFLR
jgi:hypothetical protein